jgi:glutamyl-tRNA reductase
MSGEMASDALRQHFDTVRRDELDRLRRKLVGLSDAEREHAELVIAGVITALTAEPSQALVATSPHPTTIDAIVRLFALGAHLSA